MYFRVVDNQRERRLGSAACGSASGLTSTRCRIYYRPESRNARRNRKDTMEEFCKNVLHILKKRGISQRELALRTKIPEPNISRILHGKEGVTLARAGRIASALGKKLSDVLKN